MLYTHNHIHFLICDRIDMVLIGRLEENAFSTGAVTNLSDQWNGIWTSGKRNEGRLITVMLK